MTESKRLYRPVGLKELCLILEAGIPARRKAQVLDAIRMTWALQRPNDTLPEVGI
jgi:hypothetical protein